MKNQTITYAKELITEPTVSAEDFLAELFPLLADYFEGKFSLKDGSITYFLPNGQNFILTAKNG